MAGKSTGSNTKQVALDFILQIQDPTTDGGDFLNDMELSDDDTAICDEGEISSIAEDEVIFSPIGITLNDPAPVATLEINNENLPQLQKWGPVVACNTLSCLKQ